MPLDPRGPCGYGVPREQCHVGCGRTCRALYRPMHVVAPELRPMLPPDEPGVCCGGCVDAHTSHPPCGKVEADS